MILKSYYQSLLEFIELCPFIIDVDIARSDYFDNEYDEILLYRIKITFFNNSTLELFERIEYTNEESKRTKYSYHWQNKNSELLARWDNAPHHQQFPSFPNHQHTPTGVKESNELSGFDILKHVTKTFEK